MTPAEFTEALETIGWSQRYLASLLGCDHHLARRWASGTAPIPPSIARWLELNARWHRRAPPPTDWRIRAAQ